MKGWGDLKGLNLTGLDPVVIDRFWTKVDLHGPDHDGSECWIFRGLGTTTLSGRYPMFGLPGHGPVAAHQVAYALTHDGRLPPDRILVNDCPTLHCVHHWTARTTVEAAQRIHRTSTLIPVDTIRDMRRSGMTAEEVAAAFPSLPRRVVDNVIANHTFADSDYQPAVKSRREEWPSRFRLSPEQIVEVQAERRDGATLRKIAERVGLPISTVWEAINGPSHRSRRKS